MHVNKRGQLTKFIVIVISLIIISNFLVYYGVSKHYDNKLNGLATKLDSLDTKLSSKINTTNNTLSLAIKEDSVKTAEHVSNVENKTLNNFKKLQEYFTSETSRLRLDLEKVRIDTESNISDFSDKFGSLSKKNSELEDKLSSISISSSDFSNIVEDVVKAVVSVKTNNGQGSGVIFDSRGYIITNKHVIDGVNSIYAVDYNSQSYPVDVIGVAAGTDLAVLKINSINSFNYLDFADSNTLRVGTKVIAVGNPLGLSFSVTEGIISGINRNIDNSGIGYIQTDVSINPGNSGGPLVNAEKKIVGINALKITNTEGIGFAIPSNAAKYIGDLAIAS